MFLGILALLAFEIWEIIMGLKGQPFALAQAYAVLAEFIIAKVGYWSYVLFFYIREKGRSVRAKLREQYYRPKKQENAASIIS